VERNTRQRDAIRAVIERAHRPLSVRELLALAAEEQPGIGIATVYRTIKSLLADEVLREVELPGAVTRYELAHLDHHHHFHCRRCDRVFEIEGCPGRLKDLTPRGFTMEGHDLTITGLCAACTAKPRKRAGAPMRKPRKHA
jgi:Fur family ferric uptake transcriptional regulator